MAAGTMSKKRWSVGISVHPDRVCLVRLSEQGLQIGQATTVGLSTGVITSTGDQVLNVDALADALTKLIRQSGVKERDFHLSVPATLVRMVEMPSLGPNEMQVSLSSEAEGYKSFSNAEAIVSFAFADPPNKPAAGGKKWVVFGALRSDAIDGYFLACKKAKMKLSSIDVQPVNTLRAMAAAGVLDSLVRQIGPDATWGMLNIDAERLFVTLWQGNQVVEVREAPIDELALQMAFNNTLDPSLVDDCAEEIRRTVKTSSASVWLVNNVPSLLAEALSERFAAPFAPAQIDPGLLQGFEDLELAAFGAALHDTVPFPFGFNFIHPGLGTKPIESKPVTVAAAPGKAKAASPRGGLHPLIPIGIACCVGTLLLGVVAGAVNWFYIQPEKTKMSQQVASAQTSITMLTQQLTQLQTWASLETDAVALLRNARIRNQTYTRLADDLMHMTPDNMWIHTIKVGQTLEIDGKATQHESVLDFAKQFDATAYAKNLLIRSIKEDWIGNIKVYIFQIGGDLTLSPELLNDVNRVIPGLSGKLPAQGQLSKATAAKPSQTKSGQ